MFEPLARFAFALPALMLSACSPTVPGGGAGLAAPPAATQDAATRALPVVPGRASRVFVMAGFGTNCEPVSAPTITVSEPPKQGDVSFVVGQDTTIAASAQGTCVGHKAKGTGIYYTARAGAVGSDRFSISAALASGETVARTFEVKIADDTGAPKF